MKESKEREDLLKLFERKIFKYNPSIDRQILINEVFRGLDIQDLREMYLNGLREDFFTLAFCLNFSQGIRNKKLDDIHNEINKESRLIMRKLDIFMEYIIENNKLNELSNGDILLQNLYMDDGSKFFTDREIFILKNLTSHEKISSFVYMGEISLNLIKEFIFNLLKRDQRVRDLYESPYQEKSIEYSD